MMGLVYKLLSHILPNGKEAGWLLDYIFTGLSLVVLMAILVSILLRRRDIGCLTILVAYGLVYIAQVLVYLYFRGFHWMLLLPLMLVAIWLLAGKLVTLCGLLQPKKCSKCREPGRFILTSKRPNREGTLKRYCLGHFMESLEKCFRNHNGRFIIVAPQISTNPKSAQYFYYNPDDMALDSYPQSDIEMVKALVDEALDSGKGEVLAVRIPGDAIKDIGKFDEQPLLTLPLNAINKTPMDTGEVLRFIESVLRNFDIHGREFCMNKPYSDHGIYIWFNYR